MGKAAIADDHTPQADNDNVNSKGAQSALPPTIPVRTRPKFSATWFDDISEEVEVKEFVIDGVFASGEFTYVVGKPGAGKSVIIGDAACHVGCALDWNGRKVKQGLVVYIAAEREKLVKRRMLAFRKRYGVKNVAVAVIDGTPNLTLGLIDANELIRVIDDLVEQRGIEPVWVIIDTLSRTFGGADQNKAQDMAKFVLSVDRIIKATSAHVTVIHHTPWNEERAKGAIDLDGAVDASFIVTKGAKGHILRCDGANDGGEGHITTFSLESVTIGVDEEGRETTAPVAIHSTAVNEEELADGTVVRFTKQKEKKSVRVFKAALADVGQMGPKGERGLKAEVLKGRISEAFDGPNTKPDSLLAMVRREIANLVKWGAAKKDGDWYYPGAADVTSDNPAVQS